MNFCNCAIQKPGSALLEAFDVAVGVHKAYNNSTIIVESPTYMVVTCGEMTIGTTGARTPRGVDYGD